MNFQTFFRVQNRDDGQPRLDTLNEREALTYAQMLYRTEKKTPDLLELPTREAA